MLTHKFEAERQEAERQKTRGFPLKLRGAPKYVGEKQGDESQSYVYDRN